MDILNPLNGTTRRYVQVKGEPVAIDFILKNATMEEAFGKEFVCGNVFGDSRWQNGHRIHTSFIKEKLLPNLYRCRGGSVFFVESWAFPQSDPGDENDHPQAP